ncbi:MAG: hypothetical protein ACPH5G_08460 [Pseudooceanicola atlanticus]
MSLRITLTAAIIALPVLAEAKICRQMQWHPEKEVCPAGSKHDPVSNLCIG